MFFPSIHFPDAPPNSITRFALTVFQSSPRPSGSVAFTSSIAQVRHVVDDGGADGAAQESAPAVSRSATTCTKGCAMRSLGLSDLLQREAQVSTKF